MGLDVDTTLARIDVMQAENRFCEQPMLPGEIEGTLSLPLVHELDRQPGIVPPDNHN